MSIFKIFKKAKPVKIEKLPELAVDEKGKYLGDLQKTDNIFALVKTPREQRDLKWEQAFLDNLPLASFRCAEPQVAIGPDGFPYFQLFLPEPYKEFQCFVVDKMADDFLLDQGVGVAINPTDTGADWVFTYGDIVNYYLNKTFYGTEKSLFSKALKNEVVQEDEQVMIAQPAEILLPAKARKVLCAYLKHQGVPSPKILLMMRKHKSTASMSQDLVFNITVKDFGSEEKFRVVMQRLGWFLPRHYSFVGIEEDVFKDGFQLL